MRQITAKFVAELEPGLLCRETVPNLYKPMSEAERTFQTKLGRFDVTLELTRFDERGHGRVGGPIAREAIGVSIAVTGSESAAPPETADEAQHRGYVAAREQEYRLAAETALARFIRYFRFQLGNPLVQPYTHAFQPGMLNPIWTDDSGHVIWDRVTTYAGMLTPSLRLYPQCGARAYENTERGDLVRALSVETQVAFREELLAEARDAIALGHLRRGVLELAIACEVGVKHFYFEPSTNADSAYSYLEDKGRVNARVLDFLDGIALRTFGRSLRVDRPECYRDIDWLFRCRNKVAHRGIAVFRDDAGTEFKADIERLCGWWLAVADSFRWLDEVSQAR